MEKKFWPVFCIPLWILCVRYKKTIVLEIKVLMSFFKEKNVLPHFVFFSENSEIPATS